jgi:hypothetical protein
MTVPGQLDLIVINHYAGREHVSHHQRRYELSERQLKLALVDSDKRVCKFF